MATSYPCKSAYFQAIWLVPLKSNDHNICDIKEPLWFCSVKNFSLSMKSQLTKVGFGRITLTKEHGKICELVNNVILKW